jgi:hypothetical protein
MSPTDLIPAARAIAASAALLGACGGRPVGDEGYFAGDPLPDAPEEASAQPSAAPPPSASASATASVAPGDPCGAPPPRGYPRCEADPKMPCVGGGIGECLLHCPGAVPKSWPCPSAAR